MRELHAKTAVVTGAASGIGLALARRFAIVEGMAVVLADVEATVLESATQAIRDDGGRAIGIAVDVADAEDVDRLATEAVNAFGAVHVVCNNAGVGGRHDLAWAAPRTYWEWVLSVNLWGVINGVRAFTPLLLEQGAGHIVNTASAVGYIAMPYNAPYVTAKHAVVGLSAALAHDLDATGTGVRVSVLCPGAVDTAFSEAARNWPSRFGSAPPSTEDTSVRDLHDNVRRSISTGRPPDEVAELVVSAIHDERFLITTEDRSPARAVASLIRCFEGENPLTP